MAAQMLRPDANLHVNPAILHGLQEKLADFCSHHQIGDFLRIKSKLMKFTYEKANYYINIDVSSDDAARTKMNLPAGTKILYAVLQTGPHQRVAQAIYPDAAGGVQLNTLISALQQSMEHHAIYTAVH